MLTEIEKRNQLVEENINLVHSVVRTILNSGVVSTNVLFEYDDLFQVGVIGLMDAAASYDEEKNFEFSSFAYVCIKNRIMKEYAPVFRDQKAILNFMLVQCDDSVVNTLIDASASDQFDEVENTMTLQALINGIAKKTKQKKTFEKRAKMARLEYEGYKISEIARMLNINVHTAYLDNATFKKMLSEEYRLQM